jgi:V-type H+-transporting ATPase proteolipid subunit
MGVLKPELIFKSIVPVIMAGILGIYGLIIALLIFQKGKARCPRPLARLTTAHTL